MLPLIQLLATVIFLSWGATVQSDPQEAASQVFPTTKMGEREIPTPYGISAEMREVVKRRRLVPSPVPETQKDWLEFAEIFDAPGIELAHQALKRTGATVKVKHIGGVRCYLVVPKKIDERFADRVFVHVHGGAFVFGGGDSALREAIWAAQGLNVGVVSIDYRQPPVHTFPAPIDDTVAVWREIIKSQGADQTALFGTSAGGNIVLGSTLRLKELGLPLPGALFAGTPVTDLENTTDTWYTLSGLDPLGQREGLIQSAMELYAGSAELSNPLMSPVNGDLVGFPPTILISGTRDLVLSDTVRMHRALRSAGVTADLHVYDGQVHGDYIQGLLQYLPESEDALRELYEFFDKHLK